MANSNSVGDMVVLSTGRVAGVSGMVALLAWFGDLIRPCGFSPIQTGLTVTLFLFSLLVALKAQRPAAEARLQAA